MELTREELSLFWTKAISERTVKVMSEVSSHPGWEWFEWGWNVEEKGLRVWSHPGFSHAPTEHQGSGNPALTFSAWLAVVSEFSVVCEVGFDSMVLSEKDVAAEGPGCPMGCVLL